MPTITKIAQQKRKKDRYSIFLDESYAFSVEEDVLVRHHLTKGLTLTKEDIEEITNNDSFQRAYLMAINYLSYRMRSIEEMNSYLQKKEIDPGWIEQIVVKLIDDNLLNDADFSSAYVRDRMHNTSKGPRVIEKELIEKGVKKTIAVQATKQYDIETQVDKALKWLEKEQRKKSQHSFRRRNEQLRVKLMQKGFDHTVVTEVFGENDAVIDHDTEQEVLYKQAEKLFRKHSKKLSGFDLKMKLKTALFQKGFQAEMIDAYIETLTDEL